MLCPILKQSVAHPYNYCRQTRIKSQTAGSTVINPLHPQASMIERRLLYKKKRSMSTWCYTYQLVAKNVRDTILIFPM